MLLNYNNMERGMIYLNTQDVILGLLHMRSFSGYEMKHYFETVFSFFFDASYGTIYPTLSKMEQLGYITKESISQENRPNKNIYTVTSKGKEQFTAYLDSTVEKQMVRSDFLMRMYFGGLVEEEKAIHWIQDAMAENLRAIEKLEATLRILEGIKDIPPTKIICVKLGIAHNRSSFEVLQEGLTSLQK
jgi:DNA-binding PadR family transcriptional regulator